MTALRTDLDDYSCSTCIGFGYLPEIGPCPTCQPDAYAEHLAEFTTAMAGEAYWRDIVWDDLGDQAAS